MNVQIELLEQRIAQLEEILQTQRLKLLMEHDKRVKKVEIRVYNSMTRQRKYLSLAGIKLESMSVVLPPILKPISVMRPGGLGCD